jgi:hypothetical protein
LNRVSAAFKAFFSLLFTGVLPNNVALAFGYVKKEDARAAAAAPSPPPVQLTPEDGALQMLSILQRDGRLVDFLMEDISGASDDQIGAAVRSLQEQCRAALERYVRLSPVIDGVEGSFTKIETSDPAVVKLLGNVPVNGKASGGLLRHKGWRAEKVDLPVLKPSQKSPVIAPAEIEIE